MHWWPPVVKNLSASAGGIRDAGLLPGLRRSAGGGNGTYPSILAWGIPWSDELGRLQFIGSQSQTQPKPLSAHTDGVR